MKKIKQKVPVSFSYDVIFTEGLFNVDNKIFANLIATASPEVARKVLFVLDKGMYDCHPNLIKKIKSYANYYKDTFTLFEEILVIPGGETAKNDSSYVDKIHRAINAAGLDRHSYVAVIGGGAVIDTAGFAAATAHRGIRTIRIPTTVLAQNDAAVGVKNGINAFGKKNFLGTFLPPFAVINDFQFLSTLGQRDWRSGISEAIKVALLKDADFFAFLENKAEALNQRDQEVMQKLIYRCAEFHLDHIANSGDPFEMGSSRPLDFGHWSAHKLEQLTDYELKHGEAVAIGISLDVTYSYLDGLINKKEWQRILETFKSCGFTLWVPELQEKLDKPEDEDSILHGLEEFREHLGGKLTIMLLNKIGKGKEVHKVNYDLYRKAIRKLKSYEQALEAQRA
jgi:3-dehydroquinate synthase